MIEAAREMLARLEVETQRRQATAPDPQIALFDPPPESPAEPVPESPVLQALEAVDPDGLTPRRALELVYELKRLLQSR